MAVPEVLVSGHHEAIRCGAARRRCGNTIWKWPDLLRDRELGPEDQQSSNEVMQRILSKYRSLRGGRRL